MNKRELIREVAAQCNTTYKDTEDMLNGLIEVISQTLESGEQVEIPPLGRFKLVEVAERTGVTTFNKEKKPWVSPAHIVVRFKPNLALRKRVA